MAGSKRRDLATATTGYGLVAAGSVVNHEGVQAARRQVGARPRLPSAAVYRAKGNTRARGLYAAGNVIRLVGTPAAGVGTYNLLRRKPVEKADRPKSFLAEGVEGTGEAWRQKAEHATSGSPRSHLYALGWGAGAAGGSSLAAHRALDRRNVKRVAAGRKVISGRTRAALVGTATVAGGLATLPIGNRLARHVTPGYQLTPTGATRTKRSPIRPSRRARVVDGRQMGRSDFRRQTVGKAYLGNGAWSPPKDLIAMVGSGSHKARRLKFGGDAEFYRAKFMSGLHNAGKKTTSDRAGLVQTRGDMVYRVRKTDYPGRNTSRAKQRGATMAAGAIPVIPFAGPIGAAKVAAHYAPPGEQKQAAARQLASSGATTAAAVGGAFGLSHAAEHNPWAHRQATRISEAPGRAKAAVLGREHVPGQAKVPGFVRRVGGERLFGSPRRAAGTVGGYMAGKMVVGQPAQQVAISRNLKAQERYNARHPVEKLAPLPQTKQQKYRDARRRHRNAALATSANYLGLAGVGMLAAREIGPRVPRVAHHFVPHKDALERAGIGTAIVGGGIGGAVGISNSKAERRRSKAEAQRFAVAKAQAAWYAKADPLKTYMDEKTAARHVNRYGAAGPLPKNLNREKRMQAYEARYVHSGGHQGEKWQHRAQAADKVKTAGLAGATGVGLGYLVKHPRKIKSWEGAGVAAATIGGGGELYAAHARRRRASYSSSPGGVAASALRRMRDNDAARA